MIHPDIADEATDRLLMLVSDLGIAAATLAESAPDDVASRFARLRQLGEDQAIIAAAGEAVLRNRAPPAT